MNDYYEGLLDDTLFVLGAMDPEMKAIAKVLTQVGCCYASAEYNGEAVWPPVAYKANGTSARSLIEWFNYIVFIECEVSGILPFEVLDHHRQGDPGFKAPPERYWEASSIGQTVRFLEDFDCDCPVQASEELRIIAAADHCLRAAYAGECPGVHPTKLKNFRLKSRAEYQGRKPIDVLEDVEKAKRIIQDAPRLTVRGEEIADLREYNPPIAESPEASAQLGIPILSKFDARPPEEGVKAWKINILGTEGPAAEALLAGEEPFAELEGTYGDPIRGFAGGYIYEKETTT